MWWARSSLFRPAPAPGGTPSAVSVQDVGGPALSHPRERFEGSPATDGATGAGGSAGIAAYDASALDRLLAEALNNSDVADRRLLLRGVAEFLARNDRVKGRLCVERILRSGNGMAEADAYAFVREFSEVLGARDPQGVIQWADDLPHSLKEPAYQIAAGRWSATDADTAMTWALGIDDRGLKATIIRAVDRQVGLMEASRGSGEWVRRLAASAEGSSFSDVVARQWGRFDPVGAWEWVRDLPKTEDHDRGLVALCEVLATTNPQQTLALAAELPEGDLRSRVRDEAVARWSEREPAAAVAWIESQPERAELLRRSAHLIAGSWMKRDPEAALRWVERAPLSPEAREYLSRTTLRPAGRP